MIKVEMLSTGDEVLYGQIIDTNAAWLSDYLFLQGLPLSRRSTVGDNLADLVAILKERSQHTDILIVNGGLGPTSDDLSAEAAARAAGVRLTEHAEWLQKMEAFFASRGRVMAASNRKQAMIPEKSEMIDNPVGTACGFAMKLNRALILFTPGVPSEFKVMIEKQIMPLIRSRFSLPSPPICLRMTTFGRGESNLAEQLDKLVLPEGVVLGYRSSMPIIELKLTGPASQQAAMDVLWSDVRNIAGESVIYEGTDSLAMHIARHLKNKHFTLAINEHFTAGLLSLELMRAGAALGHCNILPITELTLDQALDNAMSLRSASGSALALVISGDVEHNMHFALATPEGVFGMGVCFGVSHYHQDTLQAICSLMAQIILERWLTKRPQLTDLGWIKIVERRQY